VRNPLSITYYCNAEECTAKSQVWEEHGNWVGYEPKARKVFLKECGLPLPPTWTTIGDQHFCPNHNISIRGEFPVGEDVDIIRTGGLYEPVLEEKK